MQSDPASFDKAEGPHPQNPPPSDKADQDHGASLRQSLAELREYFAYYTAARIDALKSSVRRLVLWVVVVLIGLLAVAGMVITAVVLICDGICDALTRLLHSRSLGELLTGVLLLVCLVGSVYFGVGLLHELWHARTVKKYEARRKRQRDQFGRDVSVAAAGDNEPHARG
jgi:uncharacterized membrane protein YccC